MNSKSIRTKDQRRTDMANAPIRIDRR